ncbi:MAG TPA: WYL domain-containing protein [Acidimicrobiia bacterium]|jgi:proteasome accessory factor B|nr:WYL domain-containing protein [Acidimicrobiia bacterium]
MPDAPSRVERVLNMLALLLETRVPLTRDDIVREVSGYPEQISAYRRAFERDKETLRGMGVPITTESLGDGTEVGYRVKPDDYYLPDLDLSPAETAALRVAVSAVSLGTGEGEGVGALMKLGGLTGESVPPIASIPIAPALALLFDAFRHRAVVSFTHRGRTRTLEPWGLSSKRGHWYIVGFDRDRQAVRAFRADRIEGDVTVGAANAFEPPADFRPDDHVEARPWLAGDDPPTVVRVRINAEHRDSLLAELGSDATIVSETDSSTTFEVLVMNLAAFRAFVLGFLEHAEVLDPNDVRADVVEWLERIEAGVT